MPREDDLRRLDDEEEDGGRRDDERDHLGDERAVLEDALADVERLVVEARRADDRRDDRLDQVLARARCTTVTNAAPITNATASSSRFPRSRKARNSLSMPFPSSWFPRST